MASPILFDISAIDLDATMVPIDLIRKFNKHRFEAEMLDRIAWHTPDLTRAVAIRTVRDDEWWVRGHIPGRPLLPAVLMLESAAQMCSYMFLAREIINYEFVGFTGIGNTKFRGTCTIGDRLVILGKEVKFHIKRFIVDVQGWVGDRFIFESQIIGMPF